MKIIKNIFWYKEEPERYNFHFEGNTVIKYKGMDITGCLLGREHLHLQYRNSTMINVHVAFLRILP